jgi:hypothetical protein
MVFSSGNYVSSFSHFGNSVGVSGENGLDWQQKPGGMAFENC